MSDTHWFSIRKPLPASRAMAMKVAAFLLPLAVWSVISYVPFVWHPMMQITDVGDCDYRIGDRMPRGDFADMNVRLAADGKKPAIAVRANPYYLPAPHEVGLALYKAFVTPPSNRGEIWLHESLEHSISIIFWGFLASAVIGLPLGILCGTFDFFSKLFEPFVDFIRYMPAPAFGALMVGIFGLTDTPKVAIIFIGTFFQMVLVVSNTTRAVDMSLLEAAQTLGARGRSMLLRVIVPSIMPNLYRDMRILLGWAWTYLIIAELVGTASGISYFIQQQGRYFHYENVFAGIIIIGLIGLITDQILAFIGVRLFPWTAEAAEVQHSALWRAMGHVGRFFAPVRDLELQKVPAIAGPQITAETAAPMLEQVDEEKEPHGRPTTA